MASTTFLHLSVLSASLRKEYATIIYGRNTPYDYVCVWLLCERCMEDYMVMRYYCFVVSKDQGPTGFEEETVTWKGVSQARAPETRESNPGALVGCFSWAYPWSQSYLETRLPLEGVPIELDLGWRVRKPKRLNRKVVGMLWYSEGATPLDVSQVYSTRSCTSGWGLQLRLLPMVDLGQISLGLVVPLMKHE